MDTLVSIGTNAAYIYSVVMIFVSIGTRGAQGMDKEAFETAAMLITFILLGKVRSRDLRACMQACITFVLLGKVRSRDACMPACLPACNACMQVT